MGALYGILKVVHVLSVIVWIGGAAALAVITARLVGARDRVTLTKLLPHAQRFGQSMGGPSAGLVLLTGMAMIGVGRIPFRTLWVVWGFTGIVLHFAFAATVMRSRAVRFAQLVTAPHADDVSLAEAGRRLRTGNVIYLLIMASVVVVMVMKPTW